MNILQDRQSTVDPAILNQNNSHPYYGNVTTVPARLADNANSGDQSFATDGGMYDNYIIHDI